MARGTDNQESRSWSPARPGARPEALAESAGHDDLGAIGAWPSTIGHHLGSVDPRCLGPRPPVDFTLYRPEFPGGPSLEATVAESSPSDDAIGSSAESDGGSTVEGAAPIFPEVGDGIAGFRLVSELGRGTFGRVFLAEESLLANRLVALKVTQAKGDEPRLLARLQHSHIMPIHSVHDDPRTGLRVMCMPYFGGANLAQVLDAVAASSGSTSRNRSLLHALDVVGLPRPGEAFGPASPRRRPSGSASTGAARSCPDPAPGTERSRPDGRAPVGDDLSATATATAAPAAELRWSIRGWASSGWSGSIGAAYRAWSGPKAAPSPPREGDPMQPGRRSLGQSSYVRAAAWVIARLAEGLEHAHQHGLMHRDLKPSNILITADGTPMLLDFNLAADATIEARRSDRVRLGGTLPYMAPEHLDAFHPEGTTPANGVNERSDIYSLGLILFEMLTGRRPFGEPEPNRPILEMIRAMTEERRAGTPTLRSVLPSVPADLDAVVRKCLHPDPARRYARAADLAEDLQHFLDDEPLRHAPEPTRSGRIVKWLRRNPRAIGAGTMGLLGLAMLVVVNGAAISVGEHLRVASARLKLKGFESRFPEYQFLLNTVGAPVGSLDRGIALAEEALNRAGVNPGEPATSDGWLDALPAEEQSKARRDLAEVMLLLARARAFLADQGPTTARPAALAEAIAWLDRAERLDPRPTVALFDDRAAYRDRLGDRAGAERDRQAARRTSPSSGRDYYLQGSSMLARGEPAAAEDALTKATTLSPREFWSYFALGLCQFEQKRYAEAAGNFTICSILAPEFAWPWVNRGLALAHDNRPQAARLAFDRALQLDENLADAWAARGLLALELADPDSARVDLQRAVALGRGDLATQAALGEALGRSGRVDEALALLDRLIAREPNADLPRVARGTLRVEHGLPGGEDDFRAILATNPRHAAAFLGLALAKREAEPDEALRLALMAREIEPDRLDAVALCAWLRGSLGDPSVFDDATRLVQAPTRTRLFNAACSLALFNRHSGDAEAACRAIDYLRRAIGLGMTPAEVAAEAALASLHDDPEFRALLTLPPPAPASSPNAEAR